MVSERRAINRDEAGVALLLALLFVVLLAAIVVGLSYEMQVEAAYVESSMSDLDAYLAAKSGVAMGISVLVMDLLYEGAEPGEMSSMLGGVGLEAQGMGEMAIGVDSLLDQWAQPVPPTPINSGVMMCTVSDEYGKINLNALVNAASYDDFAPVDEQTDAMPGASASMILTEALRILFVQRGFEQAPVDAILDWLDAQEDGDTELRAQGAEADYYGSLENPFACKDGPMDSVYELLLLPGVTPEVFYGNPEEDQLPLTELLTVYGHPEGRINVNTAPLDVLEAVCDAWRGQPGFADLLIEGRDEQPFDAEGLEQFMVSEAFLDEAPPEAQGAQPRLRRGGSTTNSLFTVNSSSFRVRGDGLCGGVKVRIEAHVWRDTDNVGAEELVHILDWRLIQ